MMAMARTNKIKRMTKKDKAFAVVVVLGMALFSLSFIVIYVWMIMNSFRSVANYNANPMDLFDFDGVGWGNMFDNYKKVFDYTVKYTAIIGGKKQHVTIGLMQMFGNSLTQIAIGLVAGMLLPPAIGYVMAKYRFPGKHAIELAVILTMCIPTVGTTSAVLLFFDKLGIMNTWWTVILQKSGGLGFGVLLYGNYFAGVPWEYVESAKLDGAGNFQSYVRIMFPQALPVLVAQAIMGIIANWNDYSTSYLYLKNNPTVAFGINGLSSQFSNAYPVVFAALFLTSAMTLIIFAVFSKTIMNSLSIGGVKG